jgi:hypothetical protein
MSRIQAGPPSPNPTANSAGAGKGPALSISPALRQAHGGATRILRNRAFAAGTILTATALAFGGLTSTHQAPAAAALPVVKARPADSLADGFGVKVETSKANNHWDDHTRVLAALQEMKVRHIRTELWANNKTQWAYLNQIRGAGITALFTMGRPSGLGGTVPQLVNVAATQVPNAIYAFEGANEWDRRSGSNWAAEVRAHQKNLYTQLKANPVTSKYRVFGPSVGGDNHYTQLGDVSPWLDAGNLHTYPGGMPPSNMLDSRIAAGKANSKSKPAVSTETGYHNAVNCGCGHRPASEATSAVYYPRMVLEDMRRGLSNTFGFQLIESVPDPEKDSYIPNLGLVRYDWSRKPAFYAMRNLLTLMNDPGAGFTTGSLAYGVTGGGSDLRQMLFQKRDGTFVLFLWRDVSVWNTKTLQPISVPKSNVTVDLGKTSTVGVIRPTTSAAPAQTVTGTSVPVSLGGEVVALTIK